MKLQEIKTKPIEKSFSVIVCAVSKWDTWSKEFTVKCCTLILSCFVELEVRAGGVRPLGIKAAVEGKLHLRVANIGHPIEGSKHKIGQQYFHHVIVV